MKTTTTAAANTMAKRVAAVRAELSECESRKDPGGMLMARNLKKDLLALETRLDEMVAG